MNIFLRQMDWKDYSSTLIITKAILPKLPDEARIGSPVARPSKIVCIGLNYADHAKETGAVIPAEPVIFMKSTTALCGPLMMWSFQKILQKTDWEVELAVVIGKKASYVEESEANRPYRRLLPA